MMRQQAAASLVVLLTFCLLLNIATRLVTDVDASIPRSFSGSIITPSSYAHHPSVVDDGSSLNNDKVLLNQPRSSRPAWNASPKINSQGYLCDLFRRIPGEEEEGSRNDNDSSSSSLKNNNNNLNEPVIIRQVPGDGCCLFHAIAISLNIIQEKRHLRMDDVHSLRELKSMSRSLRHMAVRCLRSCTDLRNNNYAAAISSSDDKNKSVSIANTKKKIYRRLFIQGYETMATNQLLNDVSIQYGITPEEYCNLMEQDSYWGGGPEIVALCNVLERPIHVYELVPTNKYHHHIVLDKKNNNSIGGNDDVSDDSVVVVPDYRMNTDFYLRRMATFGSPKYDSKTPLHILSADSRFPDVSPNIIKANGNHFMAIFPVSTMIQYVNMSQINNHNEMGSSSGSEQQKRRAVIRGGDASNANEGGCHHHNRAELDKNNWLSHDEWFNCFIYNSAPTLDGGGNSDLLSTSSAPSRRRGRIQPRKVTCWYRKMLFRRKSTKRNVS
jgi:hypothetical protein